MSTHSTGLIADDPRRGGRWTRTVAVPADAQGGGRNEYWETLWADEKADAPLLLDLISPELVGRATVLESGCGKGRFVAALAAADNTVIGVDLAQRALALGRDRDPSLRLAVSDVSRLPFADGAFDAVVSLGVVEHFEAGPLRVLQEHARVLADDGVLVLNVPNRSWLRAARDVWHLGIRRSQSYENRGRIVTRRRVGKGATTPGAFHQYEFSKRQLLGYLHEAGFEVRSWRAIDVGSALGEAGLSRFARASAAAADTAPPSQSRPASASLAAGGLRRALSTMVLGTGPVGPVGRVVRRLSADAIGHLQLVVAVPAQPSTSPR